MPPSEPSSWVARFAPLIRPGGDVLDVACGTGRHARWLEARGHRVTGIDRDAGALAGCGATHAVACDLESGAPWPVAGQRFAAVVVTNYLFRPLFPALLAALDDDGVFLYETFASGNAEFGKPANPDFLLRPGELLAVCGDPRDRIDVVAFEDGLVTLPRAASLQRICAIRGRPGVRHRLSPDTPR